VIDDNKSFYERLEKQLSESSKWPSLYRFKFIVKSETKNFELLKSVLLILKMLKFRLELPQIINLQAIRLQQK